MQRNVKIAKIWVYMFGINEESFQRVGEGSSF